MKIMKISADKSIYLLPLLAAVTMLLFGTPGVAPLVAWLTNSTDAFADVPVREPIEAPAKRRCPECGVVESMREIEMSDPGATDPTGAGNVTAMPVKSAKRYEFTVRLADGSHRLITDESRASWRIGERVSIIDGMNPPNR